MTAVVLPFRFFLLATVTVVIPTELTAGGRNVLDREVLPELTFQVNQQVLGC